MTALRKNDQKLNAVNVVHYLILSLLVLAVLISDWVIGPFAVSEFFIGMIVVILLTTNRHLIYKVNKTYFVAISIFFLLHMLTQLFFNPEFSTRTAVYGIVKIFFFSILVNLTYLYIKENHLEESFLKALNIGAVLAILIGVYITIALITEADLPYEFFWRLTRSSSFSYEFKDTNIIRTRSLFSEPAHLGYSLLIILGMNLFSAYKNNFSSLFNLVLITGIILTLSYSSLAVLFLILTVKVFLLLKNKKLRHVSLLTVVLSVLFAVYLMYIFRDYLYVTVVERTIQMISGTDNSARNRIVESWSYVSVDNFLIGNGIGQTPSIQNIYAYFLSDMGIAAFIFSILFSFILLKRNMGLGILFVLLNFQKGGYLSPVFTLLILILLIFTADHKHSHLESLDV